MDAFLCSVAGPKKKFSGCRVDGRWSDSEGETQSGGGEVLSPEVRGVRRVCGAEDGIEDSVDHHVEAKGWEGPG